MVAMTVEKVKTPTDNQWIQVTVLLSLFCAFSFLLGGYLGT